MTAARSLRGFVMAALTIAMVPLLTAQAAAPNLVGRIAPGFSRPDLEHHAVSLAQYRGKVVLLNFWATWCGPCLVEIPQFEKWQKEYGSQKFTVIGVSMDDTEAAVTAKAKQLKFDYPVLIGDDKLGEAYGGVYGLPVTFVIDRAGKIRARFAGGSEVTQIHAEVEKLLR